MQQRLVKVCQQWRQWHMQHCQSKPRDSSGDNLWRWQQLQRRDWRVLVACSDSREDDSVTNSSDS